MSKMLFQFKKNQLYFDTINLNELDLIKSYQKPIILYRLNLIQERLGWVKSWKGLHRLHFAMKANDASEVLKLILKNNCGLDVVSLGEIEKAYSLGFKPKDIIFSGVGKTKNELTRAIKDQIYQINVESISELKRISEIASNLGQSVSLGLRVNPEIDAQTHPHIATALVDSKFGLSLKDVPECLKLIKNNPHLILKALSYHLGSQIMEPGPFENALKKMKPLYLECQSQFNTLERLDLGGGLGVDYQNHDMSKDYILWQKLKHVYETELSNFKAEFLLEMGRFIVARSAVLISEIQYVKLTENKEILILDVGMNNLMRPSLYQAYHHIWPLQHRPGDQHNYMIVGPICESTDFFHKQFMTSKLTEGDLVAISDVGAYGRSMASNYNLQPIAEEHCI